MTSRFDTIRMAVAVMAFSAAAPFAQTPATLNVEVNRPKAAVSPTLYGLMTEEINYSYDGGLYAEMVRNRTFRPDWTGVPYWYLVEGGNSVAKMTPDKDTGPSEALKNSYSVTFAGVRSGTIGSTEWRLGRTSCRSRLRYRYTIGVV